MKSLQIIAVFCITSISATSAIAQNQERSNPNPKRGTVFMVGGVGGWDVLGKSARRAFSKAGIEHEVYDFVWSHGWGQIFKDLKDAPHVERKANELAKEIQEHRRQKPDVPVYVVAKSGGAGLALRAAELLPPRSIERVILISAAVSPSYDLRPALKSVRREIVSYSSRFDQFILNWGTRKFGTIDRTFGPSAGLRGFRVPEYLSPQERETYDRLVQIHWSPRMILHGHGGGHHSTSLPRFLRKEVSRWLK